jgi:hypothetical protein
MNKIGTVWSKKEDPDKFFIKLGNTGKNEQYNLTVELVVKNHQGEVVAKQTDGFLQLLDPRKAPLANQEALSKVPNLQFDVVLAQDQN